MEDVAAEPWNIELSVANIEPGQNH